MYINDIRSNTELSDVARMFYGDCFPQISVTVSDADFTVNIGGTEFRQVYDDRIYTIIPQDHKLGRLSKIALYDALMRYTGKSMPWGALTGVRPSKLFYECIRTGHTALEAVDIMQSVYRVSRKRAEVLNKIFEAQKGKIYFSPEYVNLYVHVPYCTTRCTYCSFVSALISKNTEQARTYVKLLCDEIERSTEFLKSNGKKILSVYIGGGTPTALEPDLLNDILESIGKFDGEYTCEAGRPDTVTAEKCDIMKRNGVTRVCVNPQTLSPSTLEKICRNHTVQEFLEAYETVKSYGFDINCDLIAGLADETLQDFKYGLDGILELAPQNFTVHSLSKKNGSSIRYDTDENSGTSAMLDYVLDRNTGYAPYYLYRQKRQSGNLENIGFSVSGKECVNNITTMEETVGVMACGAGAISKAIIGGNITRFANMRDINLYIAEFDNKLKSKLNSFTATE